MMFLKKFLAITTCVAMIASLVYVTPVLAEFNEGVAKSGTDAGGNYIAFGLNDLSWGYSKNNRWLDNDTDRIGIFGDYFVSNNQLKYDNRLISGERANGWIVLKTKPDTVLTKFEIKVNVGSYNDIPRQDAVIEFFSDDAAATAAVYSDTVNGVKSYDLSELGLTNTVKSFKLYLYTGGSQDWIGSTCRYIKFWYDDEINQSEDSIRIDPTEVTAASGDSVNFTPELFGPNKAENAENLLWSVSNNVPDTSISNGVLSISPNEPDLKTLTVTAYVPGTDPLVSATATVSIINETYVEFNAPYASGTHLSDVLGPYYGGSSSNLTESGGSTHYFITETNGFWFAIKAAENRIISKVEFTYYLNGDSATTTINGYADDAATAGNENGYSAEKNAARGDNVQSVDILNSSGITNTKSVKITYTYPGWAQLQIKGIKVYFRSSLTAPIMQPEITNVTVNPGKSENVVKVSYNKVPKGKSLIVGVYGNDKKLLDVGIENTSTWYGAVNVPVDIPENALYVKAMIWDSMESIIPLLQAVTVSKADGVWPGSEALDSLKVLAIGNSFSDCAKLWLDEIAVSSDVDITIGSLAIGGSSLAVHSGHASTNRAAYTYVKNVNGAGASRDATTMAYALADEDWDFVTLQQVSDYSGMPETFDPSLAYLTSYIKEHCPNAKIAWHSTWAYQASSTHGAFPNYGSNQMTMYNAIINAAKTRIITDPDIDILIPCGTAVQNVRTSSIGDTLTSDGYHLSTNIGCYIAGLTWFHTLTKQPIDDLTWVPDPSITPLKLSAIKEAVKNAVQRPLEITQSTYK